MKLKFVKKEDIDNVFNNYVASNHELRQFIGYNKHCINILKNKINKKGNLDKIEELKDINKYISFLIEDREAALNYYNSLK